MHIPFGVTILALSATIVQSFPISDGAALNKLDLAIRSPSTDLDLYHTPTTNLSPRQGPDWIDYGLVLCNDALIALKFVVLLKGVQRVKDLCHLHATNKNYQKDVNFRVQNRDGHTQTFTVRAATCSATINMIDVFYGQRFRLEVQQQ